ncbi:MAG TPA: hypothetical protein ENN87_11980 [Phycisphaerales bacterium]|nr:hypothetical protein [Phycisphaerales bacterium]
MAATNGVWAIDIGSNALKALHLQPGENGLEVIGFDYVEHRTILSAEGVDEVEAEEVIEQSLRTFVERNEIGREPVGISVAGGNSFARFIKLPPVEKKRIPEIVQFEAVQQIPFDINEVEWDWQIMTRPDSPDTEVGLFAIKNEVIGALLSHFTREKMQVTHVQIGPMALYNYAHYDRQDVREDSGKAVVVLDMGTDSTTLVVCTPDTVWQRSIRIGGNAFTEAIQEAFKLPFRKAEKLKRTAPMSKYMRQIFTAMKPVYTDLAGEVQRSLGFYTSSGPGREQGFSKIIALGGGMKLQGLAKYLQQTLNVPVVRPDSFERLSLAPGVSPAKFHENIGDFGIVYGVGVQMLAEPKIEANLLPRRLARSMTWARKAKYFTVAACLLLGVSLISLANVLYARAKDASDANTQLRQRNAAIARQAQEAISKLNEQKQRDTQLEERITKQTAILDYRQTVPELNREILGCLPNAENTPEQAALYEAFLRGDVKGILAIPRPERKMLFVTRLSVAYVPSVKDASLQKIGTGEQRRAITRPEDMMMGREGYEMGRGAPGMRDMPGQYPMDDRYRMTMPGMMPGMTTPTEQEKDGPGFVVIIEGYSPYQGGPNNDIAPLMDPPEVAKQDDQSKWGLVTRLANLAQVFPDTSFELYGKDDIKHFELKTGRVDLADRETPLGIGLQKDVPRIPEELLQSTAPGGGRGDEMYFRDTLGSGSAKALRLDKETVLVDPMTNEEISMTFDLYTLEEVNANPDLSDKDVGRRKLDQFGRPKFIVRDHWFRIKAKFLWKNAPEPPKTGPAGGMMGGRYY